MVEIKRTDFNGYNGSHFTLILCYEILSQGLVSGKPVTKLQYRLYIQADSVSAGAGSASTGYINNTVVGSVTSVGKGETKLIGTLDVSIQHNDNGTFPNTNYSASMSSLWSGLGSASLSGTLTSANIPSIAVASVPTATSGNIGENIIIYTNRSSSMYRHKLKWAFGSLSGEIYSTPLGIGDSVQWKLPDSLYTQIPNAKSGVGTIICETYSSSSLTTLIGTRTCTFTAYAVEEACKPIVGWTVEDVNERAIELTGSNQKFIRYFSNVRVQMIAEARLSSTISSNVIVGNGKSVSGTDATFESIENSFFRAVAYDSRGFYGLKESTFEMVDYIKLTCNAEISRETQTGSTVIAKIDGNYFNDDFGVATNTLSVKIRSREKGTEEWGAWEELTPTIDGNRYQIETTIAGEYNYKKYYEFEIIATDEVGPTDTLMVSITAGIPVLGLFEKFSEMWGHRAFEIDDEDKIKISDLLQVGDNNVTLKELALKIKAQAAGVVLYTNSSGAVNYFDCNDKLSNYNLVIIEWIPKAYTDFCGAEYTVILSPTNKVYSKSNVFYNSSNHQIYSINVRFTVNEKNITINSNQYGTVGASNAYLANIPGWGITKVIGFKW